MQRADQRGIGLAAIAPTQALRQIVDPGVRFGDGAADFLNLPQPKGPCLSMCNRSRSSSLARAGMAGSCFQFHPAGRAPLRRMGIRRAWKAGRRIGALSEAGLAGLDAE